MKTTGIDFEEFLKTYDHINYFECIMYPDGTLEEARPSHTHKLCEIFDDSKTLQEIEAIIPLFETPVEWLLNRTRCVALWYHSIMIDDRRQELTNIQKRNIIELANRNFIEIPVDIVFKCFDERRNRYKVWSRDNKGLLQSLGEE